MTYFKTRLAELEKGCKKKCEGYLEGHKYGKLFKCGEKYGFGGINCPPEYCILCQAKIQQLKECEEEVFEVIDKINGSPEIRKMKKFLLKELGISTGDKNE